MVLCDIKPQNVLVTRNGMVKVADDDRGTVDLIMDSDGTWSGEYYTARGRRNVGAITLRREAAHG